MTNCVFCDIITKKLPAYIVHEDNNVIAILPKDMEVYGHTLVIPKKHYESIFDVEESDLHNVLSCVKHLSLHYQKTLGATGVNILNASGKDAQQSVFHLHFHIIPRFPKDKLDTRPKFPLCEIDKESVLKTILGNE
ncbi:MAG: HIT domain-containing protein [Candidatus Peribacteria bacterium]|jgi:histidine triad (HIT) family protein|nr:HIT domain-containing protein [Candidatus Peribacteria bacterium]